MIRRFSKSIDNRKDLAKKIASITGIASHYAGMPSMAYQIGNFVVEKDGTLAVTMTEEGREGAVILALKADGMIGEEVIQTPTETATMQTGVTQTAATQMTATQAADETAQTASDITTAEEAISLTSLTSLDETEATVETAQLTHNDEADSHVADSHETETPVANDHEADSEQEVQESYIAQFVPVNDEDDDFSSIGIDDWEPEQGEQGEQASEPQAEQGQQASEPQHFVSEEHQQGIEELEEQDIEPQQYAQLESWNEPQDLADETASAIPTDETTQTATTATTVADNGSELMAESTETATFANSDEAAEVDEADEEADETTDSYETADFSISFPLNKHTPTSIINLVCMIHSRGPLLSKATGGHFSASKELANALLDHGTFMKNKDVVRFINDYTSTAASTDNSDKHTVETEEMGGEYLVGIRFDEDEGTVTFNGFKPSLDATSTPPLDPSHIKAFTALATAMNKMAQKQKRIQVKTVNDLNEKYALRIWLVRLDMNGDEHKDDRKILMENLTGHTAFRTDAEREKWTKRQLAKKQALKEERKRLAECNQEQGHQDGSEAQEEAQTEHHVEGLEYEEVHEDWEEAEETTGKL